MVKTAKIEGEKYDPKSVKSSVNRRLGLSYSGLPEPDRNIEGLVEVLLDATSNFNQKLTKNRLQAWQVALFPTSYSGLQKIRTGKFRDDSRGPMQVVSGVIRAGVAHLYFITIHPFEDGNGRIVRALTDMALAQDDGLEKRYYSLSEQIVKNRKEYYQILEKIQKRDSDITEWLLWFLSCFNQSLQASDKLLAGIFAKVDFWKKHQRTIINSRQRKVVKKNSAYLGII